MSRNIFRAEIKMLNNIKTIQSLVLVLKSKSVTRAYYVRTVSSGSFTRHAYQMRDNNVECNTCAIKKQCKTKHTKLFLIELF